MKFEVVVTSFELAFTGMMAVLTYIRYSKTTGFNGF